VERVDADRAGEILRRAPARGLRAISLDFHCRLLLSTRTAVVI
jgi:hypothetical protein